MINKDFDLISKEDIERLISDQVMEGHELDYKEALPDNNDEAKKEFLADVCSFANSSGGSLIYGVKDKRDKNGKTTGVPETAEGLGTKNPDEEIRRLESMLQDGVKPRITGVLMKHLEGFSKGPVILIRVPKSWNSPHMVSFKNSSKFYARNNAGKHQLDLGEIRSAFLLSETLSEKIRRFRDDRIAKILSDETPIHLECKNRIVLHLIPFSSMSPLSVVNLAQIQNNGSHYKNLNPISAEEHFGPRYNFDGLLTHAHECYLQIFRNGMIEAVDTTLLSSNGRIIPNPNFEELIYQAAERYLKLQKSIGISPPIIILLTLLNIKGYSIKTKIIAVFEQIGKPKTPIDRDILVLPDMLVNDFSEPIDALFRPIFDIIWQACGYNACPNYNSNGEWTRDGR